MRGRYLEVGQVDGNLRALVLLDYPTYRLDVGEAPVGIGRPAIDLPGLVVEGGVARG